MGLYIQTHSMHGLFRSQDLELGRDEDTGGQIVYVLELAKSLGKLKGVDRIDIITRLILDERYPGYEEEVEKVSDKVNIVRIKAGPDKYIKKVRLWTHLDEFTTNVKKYIKKLGRVPDVFHSNYADSGLVCVNLSQYYKKPQVHTGHSLGYPKMKRLGVNKNNKAHFNRVFHFNKRLVAEQKTIDNAAAIVASTSQEIDNQYKDYKIADHDKFKRIAPGIDLEKFHPPRKKITEDEQYVYNLMTNLIHQDLKHPERRLFSVLSRLDKRKNLGGLLKALAEDKKLQQVANLIIFSNTLSADDKIQKVIKKMHKTIRQYNLYENLAMPGISLDYERHVPAYYRFLAKEKAVFVNPALIEPFGLTVVEASACGVPVLATKYGGPQEIITDGVDGILIDPKDPNNIAKNLKKIFRDNSLWKNISKNAIKNARQNYSWTASAKKYLKLFKQVK